MHIIRIFIIAILLFSCCGGLFSQEKEEKFVYDSTGRHDPFIPLVTKEGFLVTLESRGEFEDIRLEGIIYDEKGLSYAIINSNIVKTGDTFGDVMILKIEKNRVVVSKNGQILAVELEEEDDEY